MVNGGVGKPAVEETGKLAAPAVTAEVKATGTAVLT
jgi:hypothetical protein